MRFEDVTFEDDPIENLISSLKPGDCLSAARFLTTMGAESESVLEDAFCRLRDLQVTLDIADLPRYSADAQIAQRLSREENLAKQGDLLQNLEQTDPLRMYLEELAGIPAFGELGALSEELKEAKDPDDPVLSQVLNLCLSRVVELARNYTGRGVLLMDLIQEGSMGLWEMLPCYEEGDLSAFCDHWINWYMVKAVVTQAYAAGVGQKLRQAMEDYRSVDEKLLAELGRNPTPEEIAEGLHMSLSETEAVAEMLENARLLQRFKTPEPEQLPQEEDQAVENTAYFQMRQRIVELLSILEPDEAKLLTLRYGLEGGVPMKPEQVAAQLGMTVEQVTNAEMAALSKLRTEKN